MTKSLLIALFAATLAVPALPVAVSAAADQNAPVVPATQVTPAVPATPPGPPQPPRPPQPAIPPTNVQLDIVITDTISGKPEAKRVTMMLRHRSSGQIRTQGQVMSSRNMPSSVELALDGNVQVLSSELVDVNVTFEYMPPPPNVTGSADSSTQSMAPRVSESLSVVLRSGRPLLVSRSADPATDRTVTVELTATIREP